MICQRCPWVLAATIFAVAALPRAGLAQDVPPVFRSAVALVPITAVVRDSRNRIVPALGKDDFQVFENDQLRRIVDFRSTTDAPLSVALLLDTSGSMRGPNLDQGKAIASALLALVHRSIDEAALFTFDKTIQRQSPFSGDPDVHARALGSVEAWGSTSLYDAIAETAKELRDRPSPRRAVVVITDGVDTSSHLTAPEVSGLASSIDVPVYVLSVVGPDVLPNGMLTAREAGLTELASWTGGAVAHVTARDQTAALHALMAELRHQYFLVIESAAANGWHRLDVRTRRKNLTVRARSGYFANTIGPAAIICHPPTVDSHLRWARSVVAVACAAVEKLTSF
jgi:VWFA-related protein